MVVPVEIEMPGHSRGSLRDRQVFSEGLVVGLLGVEQDPRNPTFKGVAMTTDNAGREKFVAVNIKPNGRTVLDQGHMNSRRTVIDIIEEIHPR